MSVALALFQCIPLSARMTRSSCGKRHLEANQEGKGGNSARLVRDETCRGCAIGAAHARGETPITWPGGSPIAVAAALGTPQLPATKRDVKPVVLPLLPNPRRSKSPIPPTEIAAMKTPKQYTHDGQSMSLGEWATKLDVHESTLRLRMKAKMSPAQIFTQGKLPKTGGDEKRVRPRISKLTRALSTVPTVPAIAVPVGRARLRRLPKAILGARVIASPAQALHAFGYRVVSHIDTPAGLALIVEINAEGLAS